jgi:E3 ubiquitin-protein ligase HERC4
MYGQLGHNTTTHEYLPRKVLDLMGSEVTQISCGRCHMLVYVVSSQRLYSFGLAGNGQLGLGANTLNKSCPTLVKTDLSNTKYDVYNFLRGTVTLDHLNLKVSAN